MPTIGIIAEYNPFHSGHRHHIQTVRRTFGADSAIVCAEKPEISRSSRMRPAIS